MTIERYLSATSRKWKFINFKSKYAIMLSFITNLISLCIGFGYVFMNEYTEVNITNNDDTTITRYMCIYNDSQILWQQIRIHQLW